MKRYAINAIKAASKHRRDGYLDACRSVGVIDGNWLVFQDSDAERIANEFRMTRGIGDVVERALKPVVRVISITTGVDLTDCGGCHKRRDALNEIFPIGVDKGELVDGRDA